MILLGKKEQGKFIVILFKQRFKNCRNDRNTCSRTQTQKSVEREPRSHKALGSEAAVQSRGTATDRLISFVSGLNRLWL